MKILLCFTATVLLFLTEEASVKVYPGGNITLPCTIKDDQEISWIITNGNQTFVRILKLEYGDGESTKPNQITIHSDYEGRIIAVSSLTHTHSLTLMNITSTDLMLYCCTDCHLEQTYCTKLDFEGDVSTEDVEQQDHEDISPAPVFSPLLPVLCVVLFLSLVLNVFMYWRKKKNKPERLRSSSKKSKRNKVKQGDETDEISYASITIIKERKNRGENQLTHDTVYSRIK